MPALGFGTFGLAADGTAKRCVLAALKAGYRHIDTAHGYLNEREVGEAITRERRQARGHLADHQDLAHRVHRRGGRR